MIINSLNEFTDFLKICRKQGVSSVKLGEVTVSFGDLPKKNKEAEASDNDVIPTDEMTLEQQMFWSTGIPVENNQA